MIIEIKILFCHVGKMAAWFEPPCQLPQTEWCTIATPFKVWADKFGPMKIEPKVFIWV